MKSNIFSSLLFALLSTPYFLRLFFEFIIRNAFMFIIKSKKHTIKCINVHNTLNSVNREGMWEIYARVGSKRSVKSNRKCWTPRWHLLSWGIVLDWRESSFNGITNWTNVSFEFINFFIYILFLEGAQSNIRQFKKFSHWLSLSIISDENIYKALEERF